MQLDRRRTLAIARQGKQRAVRKGGTRKDRRASQPYAPGAGAGETPHIVQEGLGGSWPPSPRGPIKTAICRTVGAESAGFFASRRYYAERGSAHRGLRGGL